MSRFCNPTTLIITFSFALRILMAWITDFGGDVVSIYEQALDLYLDGELSPYGARVVYSNTYVPGALQQIVFASSLFFSAGLPWGMTLLAEIAAFLGCLLTYRLLTPVFPHVPKALMAAFVFLSPWSYLHSLAWNPSFLPLIFAAFLWALRRQTDYDSGFLTWLIISAVIPITLQFHLSFVLLFPVLAMSFFLWQGDQRRIHFSGVAAGLMIGSLTLIPYLLEKWSTNPAEAQFLSRNIVLSWNNLEKFPNLFFRFLSFPTAETTRFIANAHGFRGAMGFLREHPFFFVPAIPALLLSVWLVLLGTRFYLRKENWSVFRGGSEAPIAFRTLLIALTLTMPFIAGASFLFSIKGPSAHTFWILFPLSFVPLFSELSRMKGIFQSKALWIFYFTVALSFTLGSYARYNQLTAYRAIAQAKKVKAGDLKLEAVSPPLRPAVKATLRAMSKK